MLRRPGGSGRLRIVGGVLRGRTIESVPGSEVRPTSSRAREALFDILGDRIRGKTFLDAYAGSGAIGIEAASRGAKHVCFVEADPVAQRVLARNIALVEVARSRATTFMRDLGRAVPEMARMGLRFDFVYLDPPYGGGELDRAMRLICSADLLGENAIVIGEHESTGEAPPSRFLQPYRVARYGRTALTFHRWHAGGEADAAEFRDGTVAGSDVVDRRRSPV